MELWTNNAHSTLAADILSGATSLSVASGHGARFPNPTGSNYFYFTLEQAGVIEICKCTARSTDSFSTIVRAQQGTSAAAFTAGARVDLRVTKQALTDLQLTVRESDSSPSVSGVKTLVVPNNSLTDDGSGQVTLAHGEVLLDEEVIVGTSTSSITLNEGGSSISSAYRRLKIVWIARSTTTGSKFLRIRFNGDTGNNYAREAVQGFDTTAAATEENSVSSGCIGTFSASDAQAGSAGSGYAEIPYYGNTTFNKNVVATGGRADSTSTTVIEIWRSDWRNTAAITSVTLFADSGNFAADSQFALYGVY